MLSGLLESRPKLTGGNAQTVRFWKNIGIRQDHSNQHRWITVFYFSTEVCRPRDRGFYAGTGS